VTAKTAPSQRLVAEDGVAPGGAAAGVPAALRPELQKALEALDAGEQALLAAMIGRAKSPAAGFGPFDGVSFAHHNLKAEPGSADLAASEAEVASAIAPPVVKHFPEAEVVALPTDHPPLDISLETVMKTRFSSHHFGPQPLPLQTVSALLHYAYGVRRTARAYNVKHFPVRLAPSAGGLQPLDLYLVVNDVETLRKGLYYFDPVRHALLLLDEGNMRQRLLNSSIYQDWIMYAPLTFVMVCNMPRIFWKYRARGYRFVHADAGVLAQNFYLVGTALKLNTCAVAAFFDDVINDLVGVDGRNEFTILLFSVGNKVPRAFNPSVVLPSTATPAT
jgi:SagB-type dehydrogenase family enzyme